MSTEAAQASVAAPAPEPVVAAPAEPVVTTQNQPSEVPASGDGLPMDVGAIDAFFRGEKGLSVPASAIEGGVIPEPAKPADSKETKPTEGAKPPEEPVSKPGDEPGNIVPRKIPTANIDDEGQRALALQHSLNQNGAVKKGDPGYVTLKAAITQLEDHDVAVGSKGAKPAEPGPMEQIKTRLTTAQETLSTLRAERSAMAQDERFHDADLDAKQTAIEDAMQAVALETVRLESATEAEAGRTAAKRQQVEVAEKSAREKALDTATKQFPGLRDPKTPIGAEAARLYTEMKDPNHPDHALLHAVNASGFLAKQAAQNLAEKMVAEGKSKSYAEAYATLVAAPAVEAVAAAPDNPIPPKVLAASGGKNTAATGGQQAPLTEAQILGADMDNPDALEAIEKALYGGRKSQYVIGG